MLMFKCCSFVEMEEETEVLIIKDKGGCKYEEKNPFAQLAAGRDGRFHLSDQLCSL